MHYFQLHLAKYKDKKNSQLGKIAMDNSFTSEDGTFGLAKNSEIET